MGFFEWLKSIFAAKPATPAPTPSAPASEVSPSSVAPAPSKPEEVRFQEISRILIYHQGSQDRLENQITYLEAMCEAGLTPGLNFYVLEKADPAASYDFLLVETGSATAFARPIHVAVKEEILLRSLPGKRWEDLWADEVVLDLPDVSESSPQANLLPRLKEEIGRRIYKIRKVIGV